MRFEPEDDSCEWGTPGVFRGVVRFPHPVLRGYAWPVCEIRGRTPGPRLCVSAGVHVNEVSSIEAAIRLQRMFDWETLHGSVSIMPLVNLPAQFQYTEYLCPVDGKNINFSFPGDPLGTFSEALCDAIQHQWCAGADCYVDLHGGDLRENVARFSMYQRTDDSERDASRERLARAFDADVVVGLEPKLLRGPGRPPTAFAREGRVALMSEAGANGVPDEGSIAFHADGVMNVARRMGILDTPSKPFTRRRVACGQYLWVPSPANGLIVPAIEPGDAVLAGQPLGELHDLYGRFVASIAAPASGLVLWRLTQPMVSEGAAVLAIAVPEGVGR